MISFRYRNWQNIVCIVRFTLTANNLVSSLIHIHNYNIKLCFKTILYYYHKLSYQTLKHPYKRSYKTFKKLLIITVTKKY